MAANVASSTAFMTTLLNCGQKDPVSHKSQQNSHTWAKLNAYTYSLTI